MNSNDIRDKYLNFFQKRGHKIIPPSPLVLENDPTTLFTSSGMQPLVPYLMGEVHPEGKRVVDSQPSIRVQDIEEVGDNRHTTFFEMLGNWSFGDYFKKEQLSWIWEFLTKELGLPKEKLYVSIFEGLPAQAGNKDVPRDGESYNIWKELGVAENHIFEYGVKKNWWSRSGTPEQMPEGEIGGPDSEIFFEFDSIKHDPRYGKECHPNCDCGRFLEIGNSVFIQYKKAKGGKLEELPQKNVDFGGGFERLIVSVQDNPDVFTSDLFTESIKKIEEKTGKEYKDNENKPSMRIIADHIRASVFIINSGIAPSNKQQGYVLRRLIRRAALKMKKLKGTLEKDDFIGIVQSFIKTYEGIYLSKDNSEKISKILSDEIEKFNKTLDRGLKEVEKLNNINGSVAFDLYQTYGFPLELTIELFQEKGQEINIEEFKKAFEKHQEKSRTQSAGVFKGGLADHSEEVTRLHTATHLLHAALRKILGEHISQKGSNITAERLRFDFTHPDKLTTSEIEKIENLINEQIERDLPVGFEVKTLEDAKRSGALAFFGEKYTHNVKVYTIGNTRGEFFSKEVCGGPHVNRLSQIGGRVKIIKQEAVSQGVRRVYASISA